jgi:phage shock protein E
LERRRKVIPILGHFSGAQRGTGILPVAAVVREAQGHRQDACVTFPEVSFLIHAVGLIHGHMNKTTLWILIALGTVVALKVLMAARPGADEKKEARSRIAQGALVLDVRTGSEFASGHHAAAANIPVQELEQRLGELGTDKARPIVVYCRSGNRSGTAKKILVSAGFTNVLNAGGLSDVQ